MAQTELTNETQTSIHPATRLGPVHLIVNDLERQLAFYQQVMGFKLHWREGGAAGLGAGEEDLLRLHEQRGARPGRNTTGLYHFAVLFPNRRELARAIGRLFALRYPNYPTDHVMTETTYLDDPEGNGIELYADTPERGTWMAVNGEFVVRDSQGNLRSGRDPLDVKALFQELAPDDRLDAPLPAGTKMGHVHLHVAHLDAAEQFYHGVLGFDVMMNSRAMGAIFVSAGGYHHHIGLNVWRGVGAPPPPADASGLRYFTVILPDETALERVAGRVRQAGIAIEPTDTGLLVRDPSRNGVLLVGGNGFSRPNN